MNIPAIPKRILFLSNGHGEDAINGCIIQSFRQHWPEVELVALPIVGEGAVYRKLHVPIIGPTQRMPSGGVFYMNPLFFFKDIASGLVGLTWQQLQAAWSFAHQGGMIMATGDIVVAAIAHATKLNYVVFLSGYSSYYEGKLKLGLVLPHLLQSRKCLHTFCRDHFTAKDLSQQGLAKVSCVGNPVMDFLDPLDMDLALQKGELMIALLPGSRLPEAQYNLCLQLQLVAQIAQITPSVQFRAALVPSLLTRLDQITLPTGWNYHGNKLIYQSSQEHTCVICYDNAFSDILNRANLVIGMTGTAVEQAVGLGKPVVTIPGPGPAFTYRFAEAQQRLLGPSLQVIGKPPITAEIIHDGAKQVIKMLSNQSYLEQCWQNGLERMGPAGGGFQMARYLTTCIELEPQKV